MKQAFQSIEGRQEFGLDRARRNRLPDNSSNSSARFCDTEDAKERQIQHCL